MRLWSLHPGLLDTKGLVTLWREALLAKKVLQGKTKGYRRHPQLERFKKASKPLKAINHYLLEVWLEAEKRGHSFDRKKIGQNYNHSKIKVKRGQLEFEFEHLKEKLRKRAPAKYRQVLAVKRIKAHPLFKSVPGGIESWEKLD